MNAKQTIKGFTIIEVVLVLAIAGLIFLMVFIALPALQSGQRDTARKNDVSAVAAAVNSFTSNNRGQWPADAATLQTYVQNISSNTDKTKITIHDYAASVSVVDGQVKVVKQAVCGTADKAGETTSKYNLTKGTTRQYAVVARLEASNGIAFCQGS